MVLFMLIPSSVHPARSSTSFKILFVFAVVVVSVFVPCSPVLKHKKDLRDLLWGTEGLTAEYLVSGTEVLKS